MRVIGPGYHSEDNIVGFFGLESIFQRQILLINLLNTHEHNAHDQFTESIDDLFDVFFIYPFLMAIHRILL
jgi:hypothetical protein